MRNPCGLATPDTGLSVQGCLNDDHSAIVDLTSNEEITIDGGQATLQATDGPFSTLTIAAAAFTTLILDIDADVDGFVTFTDGAGTSAPFALDDDGENFFTLTGIVGNIVTFVTSLHLRRGGNRDRGRGQADPAGPGGRHPRAGNLRLDDGRLGRPRVHRPPAQGSQVVLPIQACAGRPFGAAPVSAVRPRKV